MVGNFIPKIHELMLVKGRCSWAISREIPPPLRASFRKVWSCYLQQSIERLTPAEYSRNWRRTLSGRLVTAAYRAKQRYPQAEPVKFDDLVEIMAMQNGVCALSGEPFKSVSEISLEHLLPIKLIDESATNRSSNLALVRIKENQRKKDRTLFAYFDGKIDGSWYDEGEVPAHVWRGRTVDDVVAYYNGINAAEGRPTIQRFELIDRMLTDQRFIEHGVISYATEVTVVDGKLHTKPKYDELTWRVTG